MATKKRVIRGLRNKKETLSTGVVVYDDFIDRSTHTRGYRTEDSPKDYNFGKHGLDTEVRLGKRDLEKLGYPQRIKIVIYSLDD